MELNKFILTVNVDKNSNHYFDSEYGFLEDLACDYFETMWMEEEKIKQHFNNKVIKLAVNSFLICSNLQGKEILMLIGTGSNELQYYISKIENFNFVTTREKELEINYLKNIDR